MILSCIIWLLILFDTLSPHLPVGCLVYLYRLAKLLKYYLQTWLPTGIFHGPVWEPTCPKSDSITWGPTLQTRMTISPFTALMGTHMPKKWYEDLKTRFAYAVECQAFCGLDGNSHAKKVVREMGSSWAARASVLIEPPFLCPPFLLCANFIC